MDLNNKIYESIYRKVVLPAMNKMQPTLDGYVINVDYKKLLCDVAYKETNSHVTKTMKDVMLPKDGDGVFCESVKNGDHVTISFKNKSKKSPYISTVYKGNHSEHSYQSNFCKKVPRGGVFLR